MKKIDRETTQRILETADIVEVVSDFVNLKKRGANWIGLCPFHNERTPSFSVSRARGICKCFSCGKGGSPVNFIMEHEQLSYQEALRYLARKYHIEIKEYELTDEERQQATERENLMAVNDFALKHFCSNLTATDDGRDIGLAYFRERGISDPMVEKFRLGYAIDRFDSLFKAAVAAGFDEKYLVQTGLCARSERGSVYDRFKGRVIYPIFSVSGRVIAFGGRTLRKDKNVAKYVNSPESPIYHKSNELYGLYQAKSAIVKKNKCILVEGYMDVISMHQVGVENVVASSGTSLTDGQIRLIHRFTENVTVIYDSDPAGIKASLRGIDLLLAQGLNIKVLLLPDGDDPDSFAQSHSLTEVEAYMAEHETDFMRFKTMILLKDAHDDPIARARVINDIIGSIAVIPDMVVRSEYIRECSRLLGIDERVLTLQLQKIQGDMASRKQYEQKPADASAQVAPPVAEDAASAPAEPLVQVADRRVPRKINKLAVHEQVLAKYIVRYGLLDMPAEEENEEPITVLDFIWGELDDDGISLCDPVYAKILEAAIRVSRDQWPQANVQHLARLDSWRQAALKEGQEEIRNSAIDLADIEAREKILADRVDKEYAQRHRQFCASYIENVFLSSQDDELRIASTELVVEKYHLSKVHTKYMHVETEQDRIGELVPRAVLELKLAILDSRIAESQAMVKSCSDPDKLKERMQQLFDLYQLRAQFARILGDRIVTPK